MWLTHPGGANLQKRYDLHHAQQKLRETIKKIPTPQVA
jgi:hypothetical protein